MPHISFTVHYSFEKSMKCYPFLIQIFDIVSYCYLMGSSAKYFLKKKKQNRVLDYFPFWYKKKHRSISIILESTFLLYNSFKLLCIVVSGAFLLKKISIFRVRKSWSRMANIKVCRYFAKGEVRCSFSHWAWRCQCKNV